MIAKITKIVVLNLIFLALLGVTGCNSGYSQHVNLDRAFIQSCDTKTIQSSFNTQGEIVTMTATCIKDR